MKGFLQKCPQCGSEEVSLRVGPSVQAHEECSACRYVTNYVVFTCKHCNCF